MTDQPLHITPDGRAIYDNTPTVVAVIVHLEGNEILVVRRSNEPGKGLLGLPGGYHMRGETWQEAGCREVLEETGYKVQPHYLWLLSMETDEYGNNLVIATDTSRTAYKATEALDGEAEEVLRVHLDEIGDGANWAFPRQWQAAVNYAEDTEDFR